MHEKTHADQYISRRHFIATQLAWKLTGGEKHARWHQLVHDWSFKHFSDPEFGE